MTAVPIQKIIRPEDRQRHQMSKPEMEIMLHDAVIATTIASDHHDELLAREQTLEQNPDWILKAWCTASGEPLTRWVEKTKHRSKRKHVRGTFFTGNNEWHTPEKYIVLVREVIGDIDLDPASSAVANRTVKATKFFTETDNGLNQEWRGRIWLNPPYSRGVIGQFADKMCAEIANCNVKSAIMLTHRFTDTKWFQQLMGVDEMSNVAYLEADWRDWLQDELCSLPGDERVEMLIASLKHNNMNSLMAMRDLSVQTRFRLADEMRDCADKMEHI
jgi:hypothetical protein